MRKACVLLGFVTIFWLCGCGAKTLKPAGGGDSSSAPVFEVGKNQIGEPCKVVSVSVDPGASGVLSSENVVCGNWEKPSAKVFVAKRDRTAMEVASGGWWRDRLEAFASCGQPSITTILDGVQAVALDCKLRAGQWVYQALAVEVGDKLYLADSIPAAYPVVERTVGVLSGKLARTQATEASAVSPEMKRLEATLAKANYSAGDLNAYRNILRIAQYNNFLGNHIEAEKRYQEALELDRKLNPGGVGDQCFLYMHIGLELSNQERFDLAEAMFERSESLLEKSMDAAADEARLTGYRAIHMANCRKDRKALELGQKATAMRRELIKQYGGPETGVKAQLSGFQDQKLAGGLTTPLTQRGATAAGDLVQGLFLEAAMHLELHELDEAEKLAAEAAGILDLEPRVPRRWFSTIKLLQATIAEWRGDMPRAEALLLSSIENQRSLFSDSRTEGMAMLALGRVYAAEGRQSGAFDAFRKGFEIVNKTQFTISLEDAIPYWRICVDETKRHPETREKLNAEMFEVAQMVRGVTVAQTMAQTMARLASGKDEVGKSIRELQDARYQRDKAREKLTLAQSDPKALAAQLADLEKEWKDLNTKIEDLERQVQSAAPSYNQILDKKVPARDAVSVLRQNEALAQVLVGEKSSFVFYADNEGITPYEIDLPEKDAMKMVKAMRNAVEASGQLRQFPADQAYVLYNKIFGPVKDKISKVNHLITVPSGSLLSLPFQVLVTEAPKYFSRTYYSEVSWMAQKTAITVAPSVQSFVNLRSTVRPSKATLQFIGLGDYLPHGEDPDAVLKYMNMPETCREDAVFFSKATNEKLPNSSVELHQIASALGTGESSLLTGNSFSASGIMGKNLENYHIVYFSTHGLLPSRLKCFREPALVVSKPPGEKETTGLLTSSDIAGLKLDADLVVLSACDTGGPGGQTGGESLTGLARSFLYAGARSLLVSHWEMLDKPATEMLITCFRALGSQDASLAEALRKGQSALIENPNTSHPMIWGAFSLIGDGGQHMKGLKLAGH